jgi:sarcosine oxidase subunit gamma
VAELHREARSGFGLVAIMARKGVAAGAIGAALGLEAPTRPGIAWADDGIALIGTGQGTWLAYAEAPPPFWAEALRERLDGLASVSDQSDGYTITRLWGEGARTVLQRGAAIDFHPQAFGPGSAATTVIAHIGAIVWQRDARPTFEIATFRSYSDSFRHWLDQVAAAL